MKRILLLLFFLTATLGFAQVGVNTTNPDPSSMLDISATNKGVLVPRVSLANVTTTMLDGTNTAATGLLIWNTNAATVGGNGVGFYYFNGTQWMPITQSGTADHDWYEVGTTTAPNAITDKMFHTGNVAIGKNTITADNPKLSIEESGPGSIFPLRIFSLKDASTSTTSHTGAHIEMAATSSASEYGILVEHTNPNAPLKYGVTSSVLNGSGTNSAFEGRVSGTGFNSGTGILIQNSGSPSSGLQTGFLVGFEQATTAFTRGLHNQFLSNNLASDTGSKYGIYNEFGSSSRNIGGELFGSYSTFEPTLTSTTNKYGSYTIIPSTVGGTHYGIYSDVTKGNSFAGYFLGRMSIGTTTFNNYILPTSRGIANQIMQTDGLGNVSWVTPTVSTDHDIYEVGGTTAPDAITDNKYTQGSLTIGTNTAATGVLDIDNATKSTSLDISNTNTTDPIGIKIELNSLNSTKTGIDILLDGTNPSGGFSNFIHGEDKCINTQNSAGLYQVFDGSTSSTVYNKMGIYNDFLYTSNYQGIITGVHNSIYNNSNGYTYGTNNSITGFGSGNKYGSYNFITSVAGGTHYGVYSEVLKAGSYAGYFLGNVGIGTSPINNYILPPSRGTNGQTMQTDGSGNVSWVTPTSSTDHDFYEVGGTTPPDNISDNMFHLGDIAIGKNAPDTPLDIYSTGSDSSNIKNTITANTNGSEKIAIENTINGTSTDAFTVIKNNITSANNGNKNGVYNIFDTEGLIVRGIYNVFNYTQNSVNSAGFQLFGQENVFPVNTGHANIGTKNTINTTSGNTQAGTQNTISAVNSEYIYGTNNTLTGMKPIGTINGINSTSSSPTFPGIGTDNWFNPVNPNSENIGTRNAFYGAIATTNYGTKNLFTSTSSLSEYGIYNSFSPSNSTKYGLYNIFNNTSTGDKYGVYNLINSTAGGTHYGLYSNVLKSGSYAGYFVGNVSIGTTALNNYILPPSRGTNGQTMQTDGAGNVSWVTPTSSTDADWFQLSTTNPASTITDNIYTQGKVSIGSSTLSNGKLNVYNSLENNSFYSENTGSPAIATSSGYFVNTGIGAHTRYGIQTNVSGGGTGQKFGVFNSINTSSTDWQAGVSNFMSGSNASFVYGCRNDISTTGSAAQQQFGVYNDFSTISDSQIMGVYNFNGSNGNGTHYGTHNRILGNGNGLKYGTYNFIIGTGTGMRYGNYNYISGSGTNLKYGTYNLMDPLAGGTHYGLYSEALKTGSYAGYFLGNVSIGTSAINNYILPASRGTNGQTMQTDGSGNVTWVNPPTDTDDQTTDVFSLTGNTLNLSLQNDGVATQTVDLSSLKDADWYEVGGTTPADAITDNIYTSGDVSVGKVTAATGKFDISTSTKLNTLVLDNTTASAGLKSGISNSITIQPTNNASSAISNTISGTAISKYGVSNSFANANPSGLLFEYGNGNYFASTGNSSEFGSINYFSPTANNSGQAVGLRNEIMGNNSSGTFVGVENEVNNNTNSFQIGIDNLFNGGGTGGRYGTNNNFFGNSNGEVIGTQTNIQTTGTGSKFGEKIIINSASGGVHFGLYADVTKAGSFAGYFLGNVSVGTNITNNYVLPPSRGTNGQIMQTDGVGNVSWVNNSASDADWYEVGGLTPADSILDNIFTGGDVSIGKATAATGKVDIEADNKAMTLVLENNNATTGLKYGIENNITLNSNNNYSAGISNNVSGNSAFKFGMINHFNANNSGAAITELGYDTDFVSTGNVNFLGHHNFVFPSATNSGTIVGYQNTITGSVTGEFIGLINNNAVTTNSLKSGLINLFSGGGTGDIIGTNNDFSGSSSGEYIGTNTSITSTGAGLKYGEKIVIDNTSGGIHCGIYSDVTKANSYAGYFLGRVSIGNTLANNYILPASRGTNGQIMQTDGVGNVSWTNAPTADADWYEVGGTNPANAITDNIFTSGDVSIGKNTAATAKVDIDANTKLNTLALENLGATVGTKNGISNSVQANANNANSSAILNAISGLAVVKYGVNNGFLTNNLGANIAEYGTNNNFFSSGNVSMMGTNNNFAPSGTNSSLFTGVRNSLSSNNHTGLFVGLANYISNTTISQQYGVFNSFYGGGAGIRYGVRNDMGGNSTSNIYGTYTEITSTGAGNKYGESITIDNTSPGTHYGIYADVTKATSYAGYFLGRVSIGSTTADNYILPTSRGTANQIMQTDGAGNVTWINPTTIAPVGWKIAGNAGTIAGSDYIGTNDAQDFDFRTNSILKLRLTQQGQLAFLNSGGSVFVGAGAGDVDDLTNNQNTFIGTSSGQLTTIGNLNTAIGHSSLIANVDGLGNTAVGRSALTANVSGSNNTSIGRLSDVSVGTLTNATAVGFSATVNASNKVRLGSATVTVVEGQVPYTNPSDARFKFNVKEDVPGLDFIKKLKPVTYNFDTKKFDEHLNKNRNREEVTTEDFTKSTAIIRTGFLAQDVEKICNDLGYNFDGLHIPDASNPTDNYGIAYSQFIMPIVKAVQEQQVIIENQKTELEQLKSELEKYKSLEDRIKALEQK